MVRDSGSSGVGSSPRPPTPFPRPPFAPPRRSPQAPASDSNHAAVLPIGIAPSSTIVLPPTLTALALGVIGFLFAEIAGMWLTSSATRTPQESDADLQGAIRHRTPLVMAACGFLFIAVHRYLGDTFIER